MKYHWIYLLSIPIGFLLTSHFLHYKKKYFWYEYASVFALPGVTLTLLYFVEGYKIISLFIFWSIAGPFLEALVGKTYLGIRGKHLWVYEKFPIFNRTSSWLTVPFWAFTGVGIWAMNQVISDFLRY